MCFFVHSSTTYSEHAIEALSPASQTQQKYACLIGDVHLNYHSYYSDTRVILYYGMVQSSIYVGPTKYDCMKCILSILLKKDLQKKTVESRMPFKNHVFFGPFVNHLLGTCCRGCLLTSRNSTKYVCLICGGHLNYHSYYSDTHVILYYGIVQ
jgi:DNA-directed RNA polymerase subunit RPC12/RpoP